MSNFEAFESSNYLIMTVHIQETFQCCVPGSSGCRSMWKSMLGEVEIFLKNSCEGGGQFFLLPPIRCQMEQPSWSCFWNLVAGSSWGAVERFAAGMRHIRYMKTSGYPCRLHALLENHLRNHLRSKQPVHHHWPSCVHRVWGMFDLRKNI